MFYDRFLELCAEKGVKPTRACIESGLSRGLAAKWKATGTEKPSADALEKMAAYFGKNIEEILSGEIKKAPTPEGEREVTDRQIKAAFFRGADMTDEEIDDAWEDVLSLREIVIKNKKRGRDGK